MRQATQNSTETESLIAHTPGRMSDHEFGNSSSVSVMSEEVARHIRAVTDPLTPQSAHLCELMQELRNEQGNRRHEETAAFRAASSISGDDSRSDRISRPVRAAKKLVRLAGACERLRTTLRFQGLNEIDFLARGAS